MKHQIKSSDSGTVNIDVFAKNREQNILMDGFQQCQSGRCGCPSDVHDDIKEIELDHDVDGIRMRLEPKDDATIDTGEVEKCLEWMQRRARGV